MGKNKNRHSWFSCFTGGHPKVEDMPSPATSPTPTAQPPKRQRSNTRLSCSDVSTTTDISSLSSSLLNANLVVFTTSELKSATQGFSSGSFIGEGGFGPVYKGYLDEKICAGRLKPQPVAVKVLDLEGMQGHKEWLTEVILLGQLRHPHLVKLVGYCYEDKYRMLVYEYMARGSLENQLFKGFAPMTWEKRIKIAVGAAKGLAFLHGVDQPVIYRDFKASNILLDTDFKAKLSDFGLAKDGPEGDKTHVSTRVMGTHGYAAPEYVMTGHLTAKSDVYSFGVVLLELLTGRRSVDKTRPSREQNLVDWARPYLNNPRKLIQIIDPRLEGQFSIKGAEKAAELAYHCVSHLPKGRPHMCTIVDLLEPILGYKDIPPSTFVFTVKDEKAEATVKVPKNRKPENPEKPANDVGNAVATAEPRSDEEKPPTDAEMVQPNPAKQRNHAGHRNRHRHHRAVQTNRRPQKTEGHSDTALYRKPSRKHRSTAA